MEIGWCDVCLRVKSAVTSRRFYADLGFYRVEGSDEEGWAVVTNGDQRLGLFEEAFMSHPITINFRGGDVNKIADELEAKGHTFEKRNPKGLATLLDPDGHAIFFDTVPGETKKVEPID